MLSAGRLLGAVLAVVIYLPTLFWHKLGVFLAGIHLNRLLDGTGLHVPWHRLIFHDWVKFTPNELTPYAYKYWAANLKCNCIGRLVARTPLVRWCQVSCQDKAWAKAHAHHLERMDHHVEYYRGRDLGLWQRNGIPPDDAVVEMVADRMGAQWGYDGTWPEKDWNRLYASFAAVEFPTARSKALFFGVCCVAGFEAGLMAHYSWEEASHVLGATLVGELRKRTPHA